MVKSMVAAYMFASMHDALHSVSSLKLHRYQIHCKYIVEPPNEGMLAVYHLPKGPEYTFEVMFILVEVPTIDSMLPT